MTARSVSAGLLVVASIVVWHVASSGWWTLPCLVTLGVGLALTRCSHPPEDIWLTTTRDARAERRVTCSRCSRSWPIRSDAGAERAQPEHVIGAKLVTAPTYDQRAAARGAERAEQARELAQALHVARAKAARPPKPRPARRPARRPGHQVATGTGGQICEFPTGSARSRP